MDNQVEFLLESFMTPLSTRLNCSEDWIISSHPDAPTRETNDLHEEGNLQLELEAK